MNKIQKRVFLCMKCVINDRLHWNNIVRNSRHLRTWSSVLIIHPSLQTQKVLLPFKDLTIVSYLVIFIVSLSQSQLTK